MTNEDRQQKLRHLSEKFKETVNETFVIRKQFKTLKKKTRQASLKVIKNRLAK